ncbi:hypothetical protein EV284_3466 [Streptomyces sp. BK022]|nr:hypothetical protein EV284_3466 [Streptomyces sp. BK022]
MRSKEFRGQIAAIKKATPKTPDQSIRDAQKTQGAGSS